MMSVTVRKWGNSLALRIPRAIACQIGVAEGDPVRLQVEADGLRVLPTRPAYRLADLLRRITPENRHHETDWGKPAGKELW